MKNLMKSILLMSVLLLAGCSNLKPSADSDQQIIEAPIENIDVIQKNIDEMSLDEKIGQLVITGFDGYTMDDNITNLIKVHSVGGVILFSKNVENSNQLLSLINSIKSKNSQNKTPLFVSIDEEGGRVSRIPKEITRLPSNGVIGKRNDDDLSYKIGKIIGEELKAFGFNMNFAPVLDINSNPNNPVIGDRSFGNTTDIVNKLGIKTTEGLIENNIVPVVKHFPGHGDTSVDSHIGLPVVNKDLTELNDFELIPFKEAIKNNVDAIMVSHILLNKIDSTSPSSMSKAVITDMLRENLKFPGVIITDDMTMGAIVKYYDIGDAAVKSINAGCDIILVCHDYNNSLKVIDSLKTAAQNNTVTAQRINESVYRILKLKEKYTINNDTISSVNIDEINNKIKNLLNLK